MELVFIFYKGDYSLFKLGIFSAGEEWVENNLENVPVLTQEEDSDD